MKQGSLYTGIFLGGCLVFGSTAQAGATACDVGLKLQDYEPNSVVARKDKNDDWNLDFTISQMFPIYHDGCKGSSSAQSDWLVHPYFSFTGRFGFYAIEERDSSPVIGKRFNPKFFVRKWIGDDGRYLDFGYAHESNGQSINTETAYLSKRSEIIALGEREEYANDYLSRGWDYIDIFYKGKVLEGKLLGKLLGNNSYYVNLKYFLDDSPLQGEPEEYYGWETNDGKSRSQVDGITLMFKTSNISQEKINGVKFVAIYTTGYDDAFKNNSLKAELTYKRKGWPPFFVWGAKGYNSDLTDYYKNLSSYGIGLELRNFLDDY